MTAFASTETLNAHLTRRRLIQGSTVTVALLGLGGGISAAAANAEVPAELAADVVDRVIPAGGVRTETTFADSIQRLITAGALDPDKYRSLYRRRGHLPGWVERALNAASSEPIVFSPDSAPYLLNLLWPLGLATKTKFNMTSQLNTVSIPRYASTGGWTLGKAESGYVYFNQIDAVRLTDDQDALAYLVAMQTFRPCCDNSTLFQDCNHGSALLGLIELAASQGATEDDLYWLALKANSYWFPDRYVQTALYFERIEHRSWDAVAPRLILSDRFSSLSGWQNNVYEPLDRAAVRLPTDLMAPAACGT